MAANATTVKSTEKNNQSGDSDNRIAELEAEVEKLQRVNQVWQTCYNELIGDLQLYQRNAQRTIELASTRLQKAERGEE